jgi:hypothetical protein
MYTFDYGVSPFVFSCLLESPYLFRLPGRVSPSEPLTVLFLASFEPALPVLLSPEMLLELLELFSS